MLTARTLPAERDLGLRLGAASYVTKPFSTKVLVQEIEKALASRRSGLTARLGAAAKERGPGEPGPLLTILRKSDP